MRIAVHASSLLLCACSFTPGKLGGTSDDAGTIDADVTIDTAVFDGSMSDADNVTSDGPQDGAMASIKTRPITIGTVTGGPLIAFPVLISITAPWLRPTSQGGSVASMSGYDIVFSSDAAGANRLDHEVEAYGYDATNGHILAWVNLASANTGTVIYVRYGDLAITTSQEDVPGVWNANFAGVWHLGNLTDSKATADGTASGAIATNGKIAGAYSFDGINDQIDFGSSTAIDDVFTGGGTAEAWFLASSFGGNARGRIFDKEAFTTGSGINGWTVHLYNGTVANCVRLMHSSSSGYGTWASPANSVTTGSWHHVAVVYNRDSANNDPTIYLDGAAVALFEETTTGTMETDGAYSLRIGNREALERTFDGSLDEARLSAVVRSAGWIATSYANQNNPTSFITVGNEL